MTRYKTFGFNMFIKTIIIFVAATLLWVMCELKLESNNENVHYSVNVKNTLLNYLNFTEARYTTQATKSKTFFYNIVQTTIKTKQKSEILIAGVKTILFWTRSNYDPLYYLKEKGQNGFIKHKCKVNNCFATDDRNLFGENINKFDAIVFNGQAFKEKDALDDLPNIRSDHQKYIFYEIQSAGDHPLCSKKLDSFFNWTMTYRLDSDLPCPFISVRNETGHIVGPKMGMTWKVNASFRSEFNTDFKSKRKLAAWFPFDCSRLSAPTIFTYMLKEALTKYKVDVDTYGNCAPLVCVKGNRECDYVNRHYFFLLILENSNAVDYVTDKVLVALQKNVVPVVYGGANYSTFLPPGSYIDGSKLTSEEIALHMVSSMLQHHLYQKYFTWKQFYSYQKAEPIQNLCSLCAAVNNEEKTKQRKVYKHFRRWWNPEYTEKCFDNEANFENHTYSEPF